MRKIVCGIVLALILMGMFTVAFNIKSAKADWTGTVYIRADGSIDPPNAPIITYDNITYTLTDNITSSSDGIVVERDNIILDGDGYTIQGEFTSKGIRLSERNNVTIQNINIKNFFYSIWLYYSSNNTISENNITKSGVIFLEYSLNNIISRNNITKNYGGGIGLAYSSNNNIVSENNVSENDGGIGIGSSSNNVVCGNIVKNNSRGITLAYSSNNTISENNITKNKNFGVEAQYSSNNTISENNITYNGASIGLLLYSSNNKIYHNNFINNNYQPIILDYSYENVWDDGYPSGGNYWSNYTGVDINDDAIGDTPYMIDANNIDRYPLMATFHTFDAGKWNGITYQVDVISNSTVSGFQFDVNQKSISFNVTGDDGTKGFCRVTIPKSLLWVEDGWIILVDGQQITNYNIIRDENHTYLYSTYNHTTKTVTIQGTHAIPEFPLTIILPLLLTSTLLAIIFSKRKQKHKFKTPKLTL